MAEYINKNKLLQILENHYGILSKRDIMLMESEDVAPVKHGKWYEDEDFDIAICSECGDEYDIGGETFADFAQCYKYCPNCGAKMDLEEEEQNK